VHTGIVEALAAAKDGDVIEIIDSATYASATPAVLGNAPVRRIALRAAAGQKPCLAFYTDAGVPATASLQVSVPMDRLDLNGLLISGGPLTVLAAVASVHLVACTLDPNTPGILATLLGLDTNRDSHSEYLLCRSITGGVRLNAGIGRVTFADSIIDGKGGLAIGPGAGHAPATLVQLERSTVLGRIHCEVLNASDCLLNDLAVVEDQQTGCVRFTRFEQGSILPRRFQSIPTEEQARQCHLPRCLAPLFASLQYGRPNYLQLAAGCPPEILSASTDNAEVGAFASALNPVRLGNMLTKLSEFMPAGLSAAVIGET
jgi:hypothetical protein